MSDESEAQIQSMVDILNAPIESLDPELDAAMEGGTIRHPLVMSLWHMPQLNALVNLQLKQKRAALDKAYEAQNWHQYIWLHERPFRAEALMDISDEISMTDSVYWPLVTSVWNDTENAWQLHEVWEYLFNPNLHPNRHLMMSEEDRADLAAMPENIAVWRGTQILATGVPRGWSWTIERERAEWFARRFATPERPPVLLGSVVKKSDVIAYLTDRDEAEIIIHPFTLTEMTGAKRL